MINSRHAKLKYEAGIDLEEFDVFYDFSADNEEFLKSGIGNHKRTGKNKIGEEPDEAMEVVEEDEARMTMLKQECQERKEKRRKELHV